MDEGGMIKHNGKEEGYLYIVAEQFGPDSVIQHPDSSMETGKKWLITRPLRVRLIAPTKIVRGEILSEIEISMLMEILQGQERERLRPA